MGLDYYELLLEVEDYFQISIEDDELSTVRTVGDLHRFIIASLPERKKRFTNCPSQVAFYRLRQGLTRVVGCRRDQVTPKVKLDDLMPKDKLPDEWQNLSKATALEFPLLKQPLWLEKMQKTSAGIELFSIILGVPVALVLKDANTNIFDAPITWPIILTLGAFVYTTLILTGLCPRCRFPNHCQTVADVTRRLTVLNRWRITWFTESETTLKVWDELCAIIQNVHGINRNNYNKDSDLFRDLGMD